MTKKVYLIVLFVMPLLITAQNVQQQLDLLLKEVVAPDQPGAVVLVAQDGRVIYDRSFGLAHLELGVEINKHHVFLLASITKQFTAVSILKLAEEGKLNLNDPVSKYVEGIPNGDQATIHHLLTHTSGIKSFTDLPVFGTMIKNSMSPQDIIAIFKAEPATNAPGEQFVYNNSGYVLLGVIIEKVSGMSFEAYINENILGPLGMKNTYYAHNKSIIPGRVAGYHHKDGLFDNADFVDMSIPYAAGALAGTVTDLLIWSQAINGNLVISETSKQKAFTNYTLNNGEAINYGYGWGIKNFAGHKIIEHGGGISGFVPFASYEPENNIYVVVLTNSNRFDPEPMVNKVMETILKGL